MTDDPEVRLTSLATAVRSEPPPLGELLAAGERAVRRRRTVRACVAASAAVVLLAGTAVLLGGSRNGTTVSPSGTDTTTPSTQVEGVILPLPTSSWEPGDPGADASIEGVLELQGQCLVLAEGDATTPIVWPKGYTAALEVPGAVVRGPDGKLVAIAGMRIQAGGGFGDPGIDHPCLPQGQQAAMIESAVSVVDEGTQPAVDLAFMQGTWDPVQPSYNETVRIDANRLHVLEGCTDYVGTIAVSPPLLPGMVQEVTIGPLTAKGAVGDCMIRRDLVGLFADIRGTSRVGDRLYFHLANAKIVLALTRR